MFAQLFRAPLFGLALTSAITAPPSTACAADATTANAVDVFVDADRDGWDDRWVAKYPEIDRADPLLDSNGDGVPTIFEMAVDNDPYLLRPKPVLKAETVAEELLKEQAPGSSAAPA